MAKVVYALSQRDDEILRAIYFYRYLTLKQVTRLFFANASKNHAGEYLKRLSEHKYLNRFPLPSTRVGNSEYVYMLEQYGVKYLRSVGADIEEYVRPSHDPSYLHLQHTLELNDVLIAASLLSRSVSEVTLVQMQHDWMLRQTPLTVHLPRTNNQGKETIAVVPDAWLDFHVLVENKRRRMCVWVELDRGSEEQRQYSRKIRGIVATITNGAYEAQFGTQVVAVAFLTTADEKRAAQMRTWTMSELRQVQKTDEREVFLFTHLPPTEIDPQTLFLRPIWTTLVDTSRVPLLVLYEG